ncbi:MAG TPA: glutaminase, partial [Clostridiaceae bacterium]|nr:glutaminase [Clostridiaceae bacterium]
MDKKIRPAAVPLVTVDSYFSVWSMADNLYDDDTRHWTGKTNGMTGIIAIDGKVFRFLGSRIKNEAVLEQKDLEVRPLSSIYTFEGNGIRLKVDFTTPLLMDDLKLMSRPASYVTFSISSMDGKAHRVKIYFDANAEWCTDTHDQSVVWGRKNISGGISDMYMGNEKQDVLSRSGDDIRIDWGYFHLAVPERKNISYTTKIQASETKGSFIDEGKISPGDDKSMPVCLNSNMPTMSVEMDFKDVCDEVSCFIILAYDDIKSIEYFGKQLEAYWRKDGQNFDGMLHEAADDYSVVMKRCADFNSRLIKDAEKSGGRKYADLLCLAYRQAIAAHKLVSDDNGEVLFFSKECFSNGCIATVDVTYPSIPLFLVYNAELVKGMLRPIFKFYSSGRWKFEFAPHDVGQYPKADGQVYGENKANNQMPVEECGNMLIATAAVCLREKNAIFAQKNIEALKKWADYLVENGFDPGNQLCTDDFAGHLSHNANLSVKAILGIASYSIICGILGKREDEAKYLKTAKDMAARWKEIDREGDHYKLTFDGDNTWSLKYNMVWDSIF